MFSLAFPTFILSLALVALADPMPSEPNPGNVFKEGSNITASWTPDTTAGGPWKTMNIQLMTGDNFQMVPLTTVGTVDGTTSPGTFTFTCPAVTIHAPIYFLQFSYDATHVLWTGRFTITDASGATVPAPNATQPNGQAIPWGTGALVNPGKATPPPSYFPGGSPVSSNASVVVPVSSPGSSTSSSSTPSVSPSSNPGGSTPLDVNSPNTTNTTSSTTTTSLGAINSGNSDKSSGGSSSGALVLGAVSARAAQAGIALAVVAGTFMFLM